MIKNVTFVRSSSRVEDCPSASIPEFVFIGRSNVGKSSLLNFLCDSKTIAKTSSTPGKTKLINHFLVEERYHLVDLPGYGYAKLSKKERSELLNIIENYFKKRNQIFLVFILIDSRLPPQQNDIHFINNMGENGIPFNIIFTKTDKLPRTTLVYNIEYYKKELLAYWEVFPTYFLSSIKDKNTRTAIVQHMEQTLNQLYYDKTN